MTGWELRTFLAHDLAPKGTTSTGTISGCSNQAGTGGGGNQVTNITRLTFVINVECWQGHYEGEDQLQDWTEGAAPLPPVIAAVATINVEPHRGQVDRAWHEGDLLAPSVASSSARAAPGLCPGPQRVSCRSRRDAPPTTPKRADRLVRSALAEATRECDGNGDGRHISRKREQGRVGHGVRGVDDTVANLRLGPDLLFGTSSLVACRARHEDDVFFANVSPVRTSLHYALTAHRSALTRARGVRHDRARDIRGPRR